jgi:hypothetical protein
VIAVVLLLLLAAAAAVLALMPARTSSSTSPAYAPVYPKISPATTAGIDVSDNTAAENVVVAFYDRINAGDYAAVRKLVADDTKSAVDKGAFAKWTTTTVEVAQSTVDGNAAEILVRESVREFGSKDRGVKFVLGKIQGVWLIRTWTGVDEATLNGAAAASGAGAGATTLNEATARNLVSTLLKARQGGDAATIRVLTTQKFQEDNAAVWLDGVDNTPYFTAFSIKTAKAKGATWVVTVTEQWNSGAETGTYTVVKENSAILVSAWSSK